MVRQPRLSQPRPGEHWREHHGITRCVTEEGQQHFKTVEEAMKWIKDANWMPFVYRDDGLMVGWDKKLSRKQLSVEVWQILIDGKKPKRLPGSQDDKIVVETVETETVPLVKAVASNDLKAVTALLAKGADANVKNSVEIPVLLMAIRLGSAPMVEALLKNRADPNVRNVDTDLTPLLEALDVAARPDRHRQDTAGRGCGRECGESEGGRSPQGHDALDVCGRRRKRGPRSALS